MNEKDLEILKNKLKSIGTYSLELIGKYKSIDNETFDKLVKINYLAHEMHDSLEKDA